jgi:hypothetical protein
MTPEREAVLYFVTADGEPVTTYANKDAARRGFIALQSPTTTMFRWDGRRLEQYHGGMGWYSASEDCTPIKVWDKCRPHGLARPLAPLTRGPLKKRA